ncbi:MAG TPA: hypothetical protein VK601_18875, partial [Kofleriaceae bacterium]|nr:hypothetical protein [Kofleriaceae bacterium]
LPPPTRSPAEAVAWVQRTVGRGAHLTLVFSADVADRFRQIYEAEAGRKVDSQWDVHSLLTYGPDWKRFLPIQIDGRAPLDVDGMTSRMEDVLERTLRRS